jgi:hypothetical protein
MERADCNLEIGMEQRFAALLYHPRRPCANPGPGVMMNKQQATGVRARSWLTD